MANQVGFSSWWGRHSVETGHTDFWQIGPLNLWVQHMPHQWRLSWRHGDDWLEPSVRSLPGAQGEMIPKDASQIFCAFGESRPDLIFAPALADRPLVARLTTPLFVLPDDEVNIYVISPLWLRLEMTQPSKLLHEIPIFRLSDSWFGPMSSQGHLCYASTTPAFLDLREVPLRLHCAISAVHIRNLGQDSLRIERINVPLPKLSLFYSPRTGFWTDTVALERKDDSELAHMRLTRQPPADASPTQFVTGPRQASDANSSTVFRAFSALFRERSQL